MKVLIVMGIGCWKVLAVWHGQERVVFKARSIFDCIKFAVENGGINSNQF